MPDHTFGRDIALRDDSQQALSLAEPCMSASPYAWTANVASNVVRFGHWKAGDLVSFYATPWVPFFIGGRKTKRFASVYRLCLLGLVKVQELRLELAERHYLEAIRQAERHAGAHSVAAALPASLTAQLRYEQGRFQEAEAMVVDRLPIINAAGMLECALSAYVVLARVAAWRMNSECAYALLDQAETLGHTRQWGRLLAAILVERLKLYVFEDRMSEADACLARLRRLAAEYLTEKRCAWSEIRHHEALASAHAALAQNRAQEALVILRTLRKQAEASHNHYVSLRLSARSRWLCLVRTSPSRPRRLFAGR